jgi:hypothetical protein
MHYRYENLSREIGGWVYFVTPKRSFFRKTKNGTKKYHLYFTVNRIEKNKFKKFKELEIICRWRYTFDQHSFMDGLKFKEITAIQVDQQEYERIKHDIYNSDTTMWCWSGGTKSIGEIKYIGSPNRAKYGTYYQHEEPYSRIHNDDYYTHRWADVSAIQVSKIFGEEHIMPRLLRKYMLVKLSQTEQRE